MEQNVAYHREGGLSFLHCNATSGGKRPEACAGHSRYLARPVKCRFNAASPPAKICPIVTILGQQYIAMTHMMAGLPVKEVGDAVADLSLYRPVLRDAVEFLMNGY